MHQAQTQAKRRIRRRGRKVKPPTKAELAALRDDREVLHITLQMVADEAAKTARFGTCSLGTVSSALYGDRPSRNVVDALRRLIAETKTRAVESVA